MALNGEGVKIKDRDWPVCLSPGVSGPDEVSVQSELL